MNNALIFELIKLNKTSIKKVSEATGISTGNISDWKSGRSSPSVSSLNKIAKHFGIPLEFINLSNLLNETEKKSIVSKIISLVVKRPQILTFESEMNLEPGTIKMWENGESISYFAYLDKIAEYFDVSVDYLLGKTNIKKLPANAIPYEAFTHTKIPIVGRVAAGLACLAEENIEGYEYAEDLNPNHKYIFLRVKGDSMAPDIKENDLALVKCQTSVDSGKIAVVIVNGDDGVIKKIKYGDDWIELHSINPYYPPRRFEGADVLQIHVVGLVVGIKRKFEE